MRYSAAILAAWVAACGGGGGSGSAPANPLGANFTGTARVDALSISFRLRGKGLVAAAVVEPVARAASGSPGALYILGVPLMPGVNSIRIQGQRADGTQVEDVFRVENSLTPHEAVDLRAAPLVAPVGTPIALSVLPAPQPGPIVAVLWDFDGDGTIDAELPEQPALLHDYAAPGSYAPSCTIETAGGLLFTSRPDAASLVGILPDEGLVVTDTWLGGLTGLGEVHAHPGADELFVLSPADSRVFRLSGAGVLLASIDVPGAVGPAGLACAENGDLYVADTGNGRIVRLLASSGYVLDVGFGTNGALGSQGSGPGELDAPQDVALARDPLYDELRICVADLGNARVQIFDELGIVQLEVRGDEQGGAPLQQPLRLEPAGPFAFAVLDRAGAQLRFFDLQGNERTLAPPGGAPSWSSPSLLAQEASGSCWAVYDSGAIHLLRADQAPARTFHPPFAPGGIAFTRAGEAAQLVLSSADAGSAGLHVIALAQDAPGLRPQDAVAQLVAAIGAADTQAALAVSEGALGESLAAIFADPQDLAELQALVAGISSTQLVEVRGSLAQLLSSATLSSAPVEIEWLVARSRQDRRWRVLSL